VSRRDTSRSHRAGADIVNRRCATDSAIRRNRGMNPTATIDRPYGT